MKVQGFAPVQLCQNQKSSDAQKPSQTVKIKDIRNIITHHFDEIEDPRVATTRKHLPKEIFTIAVLAVIAGARGWEDLENYGISKQLWLEEFLTLPHGIKLLTKFSFT